MQDQLDALTQTLTRCVEKKDAGTSSIAYSPNGSYAAGSMASDTNSLNISSEQAALILSSLNTDYGVHTVVTLAPGDTVSVSPVILKIMVDHSIRTGVPLAYKIINSNGTVLFETENVSKLLPFYTPERIIISRFATATPGQNFEHKTSVLAPLELRSFAIKGLERNFPLYDSASGYGTALMTKSGKVYFGGQYSSPDKRLSLHSEVNTIMSAIMNGDSDISHIGIVSSKYTDTPCDMCGICRQFISEISSRFELSPTLYCFAKETPEYREYAIDQYLPSAWTSKKWKPQL